MNAILRAVTDSSRGGLVVAGPAGMGKSRLAQEFAARLDGTRFLVRSVSATSVTADIAFGALATFVADRSVPAPSQTVLITTLSARLADAPRDRRAVVVVDDAHLLDQASVAVLLHLARARAAFVLVVARSGEPGINALSPLWSEGLMERIDLAALSKRDTEEVLRRALDGQVAALTTQRLYEVTGGNPLLLRELIASGLDSAALSQTNGVWKWSGPWLVAPRLTELVAARLGDLDADERWLLELVALSEPVGIAVISRLVSEELLVAMERRGLLWVERSERRSALRLAHPLYAEALRDACPPLRARRAKRELSEALAAIGTRRRDDVLQIARWRLEAEVPVDAGVLVMAAQRAWSLVDLPLAERLARQALISAFSSGNYEHLLLAARTLWRVLISGERHAELLEMIEAMGPYADDAEHRARGAIARAETLFWGMGDHDLAVKSLESAEEDVTASAFMTQEHAAVVAIQEAQTGNILAARDTLSALDLAHIEHPDSTAKIRAALEIIATYGGTRLVPVSLSEDIPEAEDLPWVRPTIELLRVQRELLSGRLEVAAGIAARSHASALQTGWDFAIMLASIGNAQIARHEGRIADAKEWLREAAALHNPRSATGRIFHGVLYGERAHTAAMAGELDTATATLDELAGYNWPPGAVHMHWVDLARPWASAARGAARAALDEALQVAARARESGAYAVEAVAWHDAARLGDHEGLHRLREVAVAEHDEEHLVWRYVRHAEAIVRADAAALEGVATEFEQLGRLPVAIEAYLRAGRAYADTGRQDSARRCRAFASRVRDRCRGLHQGEQVEQDFAMTAREHEVALLAVSGRTNRQIAEGMGIAKRTVDNHLARVYGKLGISTREELRRFLGPE